MDMAKRKYSKMKKIEPAVQTMLFATKTTSGGSVGKFHVDLSQCASIMNRRFYRQGINWAVSSIKITSSVTGTVSVSKLPNTWILSNAWEKSFRVWQQMIKNATDESGSESIKGKFLDFKIFADEAHHQDGFEQNLLPVDGAGNAYAPGQWDQANIFIPVTGTGSAQEFDLIAVGQNDPGVSPITGNNAKSIIQGYADSRALPSVADPNVPADAAANWMVTLFNDGIIQDGAVVQELLTVGDQPPYLYENSIDPSTGLPVPDTMYPGGETQAPGLEFHDSDTLTATTIGGMSRLKGGNFPCGLLQFQWAPSTTGNILIQVDLVPGTHRGYLCEPMTEM